VKKEYIKCTSPC